MVSFVVGLLIGVYIGSCIIYFDVKSKVVKGLIPFIDASASMAWKEKNSK